MLIENSGQYKNRTKEIILQKGLLRHIDSLDQPPQKERLKKNIIFEIVTNQYMDLLILRMLKNVVNEEKMLGWKEFLEG